MSFEASTYVYAGFLIVFGVLCLWYSRQAKSNNDIISFRTVLIVFGFFQIAVAYFAVLTGVAFSLEYSNQAECRPVISNTTVNGAVTSYEYVDSCDNRTIPSTLGRLFNVFTWVIWGGLALLFFGSLVILAKWVARW